jgi:hypothetical protein
MGKGSISMSKRNKHKGKSTSAGPAPVGGMAAAAAWPLYEVLLSRQWDTPGGLVTILVARQAPDSSKLAAAFFIVDLGCLGVKRVQVKRFPDEEAYFEGLRARVTDLQPMAPADLDLVAKIIYTGLDYAASMGFKPDFVFAQAEPLLRGAEPDRCSIRVPTGGPNGKPFFVNGPHDDVDRILAQLRRVVGDGNFDYLIGLGDQGF